MRGAYVRLLNCESRFREGYLPVARPINYRLDLSGGSLENYAKESVVRGREILGGHSSRVQMGHARVKREHLTSITISKYPSAPLGIREQHMFHKSPRT